MGRVLTSPLLYDGVVVRKSNLVKEVNIVKKLLAGVVLGAVLVGGPVALAHHGGVHYGRYRQVEGPAFFPERVVIRCPGWAEDVAAKLTLVEFEHDQAVYRCLPGDRV
jgi:hypothetical protein